jgi:hypothetical protein
MMDKFTKVLTKDIERRATLKGIEIVETEIMDSDQVKSITLKDTNGAKIKVSYSGYSGIYIYALKEPEYKKMSVLKGKFKGLEVYETFEYESEAKNRKEELEDSDTLIITNENVEVN